MDKKGGSSFPNEQEEILANVDATCEDLEVITLDKRNDETIFMPVKALPCWKG